MPPHEPGLLRDSLRFSWQAVRDIPLMRMTVLVPVLVSTLVCIALAELGIPRGLKGLEEASVWSPRLFGLLFLPAEFLIYDLVQGAPDPRLTFRRLWLDWRFLRDLWSWLLAGLAVWLPTAALSLGLVFAMTGSGDVQKLSAARGIMLALGILAIACASLCVFFRFVYLSMAVARREKQPLRAAFRETRGRMWRIGWALFLPFLAMLGAGVAMELLGGVLLRALGNVVLAPWFLLSAGLTGYLSCLSATVLAFSRQRLVLAPQAAGLAQDVAAASPEIPPAQ
ncbi:hypothetical protein SAMN04488503_2767 [Humidesulfovibrio mexicanus]|uniref:Uncharacterized protein n=1 Tax=Humidesulfovibrio mexicanus TaxID=147047 RepID=A0A239BRX6_9BACT|nr:hypothetical protein [Humidesulfovibrio mexicanus]SNS10700.1 hypothetical protein SAMN04488503_2767 [Humidesulfovibrio mexicanus]